MTQILTVATNDFVLLAADRKVCRLFPDGRIEEKEQDVCKLVSLGNIWGVAYTGLAEIQRVPTYEWIAKTLAAGNCRSTGQAGDILSTNARQAVEKISPAQRRLMFAIAGFAYFKGIEGLRPHVSIVSNFTDKRGQPLSKANNVFDCRTYYLKQAQDFLADVEGTPIGSERKELLVRNLRKLVAREIGPRETLRLLVDEILSTSKALAVTDRVPTVGTKILGLCIPRQAVECQLKVGGSLLMGKQPDLRTAAFTCFDPVYNQFEEHGPAFVWGEMAYGPLVGKTDPVTRSQSASVRILHVPTNKPASERKLTG